MFEIRDDAVTHLLPGLDRAITKAPEAHQVAHIAALSHLHEVASRAAEELGGDPSAVVVDTARGTIGIDHTPAGDKLADLEFGTPGSSPQALLRQAVRQGTSGAQERYHQVLSTELGWP